MTTKATTTPPSYARSRPSPLAAAAPVEKRNNKRKRRMTMTDVRLTEQQPAFRELPPAARFPRRLRVRTDHPRFVDGHRIYDGSTIVRADDGREFNLWTLLLHLDETGDTVVFDGDYEDYDRETLSAFAGIIFLSGIAPDSPYWELPKEQRARIEAILAEDDCDVKWVEV